MSRERLENLVDAYANRATLFADLRKLYPDAEAFENALKKCGEEMMELLSSHPKLVKWAFFDAMRLGLEKELMEEKRAHCRI